MGHRGAFFRFFRLPFFPPAPLALLVPFFPPPPFFFPATGLLPFLLTTPPGAFPLGATAFVPVTALGFFDFSAMLERYLLFPLKNEQLYFFRTNSLKGEVCKVRI